MNDAKPKPALTPEEWAKMEYEDHAGAFVSRGRLWVHFSGACDSVERPLAVAAFALQVAGPDGKPLFTREMVGILRKAANRVADHELAHEAVGRLESLLPPA